MSSPEYLAGAVYLAAVLGSAAVAAALVVVRRGGSLGPVPALLAWGVLAALGVLAAHLLPGILGLLSREAAALTALLELVGVVALVRPAQRAAGGPEPVAGPRSSLVSACVAVAAVAGVAIYVLASTLTHADEVLMQIDVTTFHLPNVARWIQGGSVWQVDDFIPGRAPGNYPQSGDVFMLSAVLPWESDFLVRFAGIPFLAMAGLGVYAAGCELGAAKATAALLAAAVMAMPAVIWIGTQGLADPFMVGTFAPGCYFLLRHWRTGDGFDLIIAGVGLGISFGTRWYAVTAVAAVLAVWAVSKLLAGGRRATLVREAAVLCGLIAACGGFWLIRNLVESGNPVFPVSVAPFGVTIFDAPPDVLRELEGFTLAHYATDPAVWREYLWGPFLDFMSWSAVALWAALVAAGIVSVRLVRAGRTPAAGKVLALTAVAALITIAYVVTPYSATGREGEPTLAWVNARYVVPALLLAAPAVACLVSRAGRWRPALEVAFLIAALDGVRRSADLPLGGVGPAAVGAAAVVVAATAALVLRPPGRLPGSAAIRFAAAAGAGVALLVVGGAVQQSSFNSRRYAHVSPVVDFVNSEAPEGWRIGVVGEAWGNYPLFGPRLENDVAYFGERVDEMLQPYDDEPAFRAALAARDYDLVLAERIGSIDPDLPLRQERWLQRLGYTPVASGEEPATSAATTLYAPPGSDLAGGTPAD